MINQKHRRTVRWNNYDYSREGSYFITINSKDKFPYFGEIQNGIMCLSPAGQIVYKSDYTIANESIVNLDVKKLSVGNYIVRIITADGVTTNLPFVKY